MCPSSKIEHKIQDDEISFDGQVVSEVNSFSHQLNDCSSKLHCHAQPVSTPHDRADVYGISSLACTLGREGMAIPGPSPERLLTITLVLGCLSCGVCVPRPSISGISPNNITAGGNNFLLTVDGSDFRRDSVVSWNGSLRVTSFVSSQLLAAITAAAGRAKRAFT